MNNKLSFSLLLAVLVQCSLGAQNIELQTPAKTNLRIVGGKKAQNKYVKGAALIIYTDNDGNDV